MQGGPYYARMRLDICMCVCEGDRHLFIVCESYNSILITMHGFFGSILNLKLTHASSTHHCVARNDHNLVRHQRSTHMVLNENQVLNCVNSRHDFRFFFISHFVIFLLGVELLMCPGCTLCSCSMSAGITSSILQHQPCIEEVVIDNAKIVCRWGR